MDVILGIDTSCYTTSAALVDLHTGICVNQKHQLLQTKQGERGLRQSTALFFHIQNLPNLLRELLSPFEDVNIKAVCASTAPRPVENSYMPVFEAGRSIGQSIAAAEKIPFFSTTHQENHIAAALNGITFSTPFLALHLSGGTTELLLAEESETGFQVQILSATKDISFGQLIDRIGVLCGYSFPAGQALEQAAQSADSNISIPVKLYEGDLHLSGAEKQFMDMIGTHSNEEIAYALFQFSAALLEKWIAYHAEKSRCQDVLLMGGVSSNQQIRRYLSNSKKLKNLRLHFAAPELCRDNAVGAAKIGYKFYQTLQRRVTACTIP